MKFYDNLKLNKNFHNYIKKLNNKQIFKLKILNGYNYSKMNIKNKKLIIMMILKLKLIKFLGKKNKHSNKQLIMARLGI